MPSLSNLIWPEASLTKAMCWESDHPFARLAKYLLSLLQNSYNFWNYSFNVSFFLTAAEVQIMSLLEYIKHQQEQLIVKVNYLTSKLNPAGQEMEVPDPIQFPLTSMEEVEDFEGWLKDPANSQQKQSVVSLFFVLPSH